MSDDISQDLWAQRVYLTWLARDARYALEALEALVELARSAPVPPTAWICFEDLLSFTGKVSRMLWPIETKGKGQTDEGLRWRKARGAYLRDALAVEDESPLAAREVRNGRQPDTVKASFADFAENMKTDGFAFLYEQMQAETVGPVLTVASGGQATGAIGPMETMADAGGATQLLPQYFGVLPEYRGHGYGRALWRAAMHWGHEHGASYQLLQTEVGGASDRLCMAEGLTSLGYVCTRSV